MAATAPSAVPSCCLCSRLLRRVNERRVLRSPSTSHIWTVLNQVTAEMFPGSVGSVELLFPSKAYLCKTPCVSSMERLLRLRQNLHKEEQGLRAKLVRVGEAKRLLAFESEHGSAVRGGKLITLELDV